MPNYMRRKLIVYLTGIFTLAIGSNLFLNAALGVAPSCSLALTFTFLLPGSYALFNFIVNTALLILEALIVRKFGKTQIIQLFITILLLLFVMFQMDNQELFGNKFQFLVSPILIMYQHPHDPM